MLIPNFFCNPSPYTDESIIVLKSSFHILVLLLSCNQYNTYCLQEYIWEDIDKRVGNLDIALFLKRLVSPSIHNPLTYKCYRDVWASWCRQPQGLWIHDCGDHIIFKTQYSSLSFAHYFVYLPLLQFSLGLSQCSCGAII